MPGEDKVQRCRCAAPAMRTKAVRQKHGGGPDGKKGQANPTFMHGRDTLEAIELRRGLLL
jgi:hypothetical protein